MMQKIEATSPEAQSANLLADNVAQLKALFPELVTEGPNGPAVNLDVLKALVGDATVTDAEEKYGLNWHGKRAARQLALTPSTGTLRPCPDESVDWDTTKNLMIEGDNLEVLKLLQKSYAGKVQTIYIDPPYNTGKDFIYPDTFQDSVRNYLELTGQLQGGKKISSNSESGGRFHTNWLNMMYPRLRLARSLLRSDGMLFASISDVELPNLRLILDEVFGEENFLGQLIWMKGKEGGNDNDGFGLHHDYIVCYAKSHDLAVASIELDAKDKSRHSTELPERNLVKAGDSLYKAGEPFQLINLSKQKDYRVSIPLRDGTQLERDSYCPQSTVDEYIRIGKIFVGERRVPYVKSFLSDEAAGTKPSTLIGSEFGTTKAGGIAIRDLFGDGKIFSYPKPPALIRRLIRVSGCGSKGDLPIVLDFFAGSGTTAQAVMEMNAEVNSSCRFICVQLPEPLDPTDKNQTAAVALCDSLGKPRNIAELAKERIRRAAAKVKSENPLFGGDSGFRVLKLDSSNVRAWSPASDDMAESLLAHSEHLVPGRTDDDVLTEILLRLGLDLCVPTRARSVVGKQLQSIAGGVIIACLDPRIEASDVEQLAQGIIAWHKELAPAGDTTCVFRDSAFADDVAKTNMAAILEQNGIANVRSL